MASKWGEIHEKVICSKKIEILNFDWKTIEFTQNLNVRMNHPSKKVAIIADWLIDFWWAELVISHLLEAFPEADIYTSVYYMDHPMLEGRKIYTSWIEKIPFFSRHHKLAGILRPFAFRSFDLTSYDIIISSSSAESKNAGFTKRKPWAKHFCYCHTPTRYYWSHAKEYEDMMEFGILNPLVKVVFRLVKWWMQKIDFTAAQKVDFFIANSKNTQERIKTYYQRKSVVIYPGINTITAPKHLESEKQKTEENTFIHMNHGRIEPYYISIGRCIPYKRFDLLVDTFNANGKRLILCTATDTQTFRALQLRSRPNIEWKFSVSNEEKYKLLTHAKAFLFPPEEDFGLVPVEAMAWGIPVIAYGRWGALETVQDGKTGIFFSSQTPEALDEALERFDKITFDREKILKHAKKFSKENFKKKIIDFIK